MYILKAGEGCVLKMRLVEANGAPIELRNARFVQAILHLPNEATMLCEDVRFDEVSQLVFVRLSAKSELTMEGVYGININALFDDRRVVTSAVLDFAEVKSNAESRYYELLIDLIVSTTDVPSCVKYTGASPKISENGTWLVFNDEINAFEDTGISIFGKSAYQAAIESGNFSGTEEEFNAYMGSIPQITNDAILATESANKATENANKAGAEATTAKENAKQATEQAKVATANANSAAQRANNVIDNLETGSYPSMTVGKAENLVGRGEATEEYINFRQSAGNVSIEDGSAKITKIKGNSVVYNQQINNELSTTSKGYWAARQGYDFATLENGVIELSRNPNVELFQNQITQFVSIQPNDKFYCCFNFESHNVNQYSLRLQAGFSNGWSNRQFFNDTLRGKGLGVSGFVEDIDYIRPNYTDINRVCIWFTDPQLPLDQVNDTPLKIWGFKFINLTKMFGVGNEPTTVEEYHQRKPIGVDTTVRNTGEILSNNVTAIKSVGENAYDKRVGYAKVLPKTYNFEGTYTSLEFATTLDGTRDAITLDENDKYTFEQEGYVFAEGIDICINIKHSYDKPFMHQYQESDIRFDFIKSIKDNDGNELFPNGLRSAGTAYDEIRYNATTNKWEAVKRVGEKLLKELTWKNDAIAASLSGVRYESSVLTDIVKGVVASDVAPILSVKYTNVSALATYQRVRGIAVKTTGTLSVYDDAYTDASLFVQSLTDEDVIYYELANPIIIELDINFNPTYLVWDFGTEEALASVPSAPFRADIVYQFNAVDRIRNNSDRIAELEAKIASLVQTMNAIQTTNMEE